VSQTKVASGNIKPSRFVKIVSQTDGQVAQAGAGNRTFGISQEGTRNTPLAGFDDGYAAIANENLHIYTPGDVDVLLMIGSGGCAPGDRLKAGSDGEGIVTTTNLDEVGAIAESTASQYGFARVRPVFPQQVSS
jgi:hypothetical protein